MRIIGIRHRWKDLAGRNEEEGAKSEQYPTLVAIKDGGTVERYALQTETDELDFLLGKFPVAFRVLGEGEPTDGILARHVLVEKKKGKPTGHTLVPESYEGFRMDDIALMALGGSGDRFAYALSRRAEEIGSSVYRIEPGELNRERALAGGKKDDDPVLLIETYGKSPGLFRLCGARDREQIEVVEAFRAREAAQEARKGAVMRLRQRLIGRIFLSEEGRYPEGLIEEMYDAAAASDAILHALETEETLRDKELKEVVSRLRVYREVFEPVEGLGPAIAARIIAAVGDIRRFPTEAKFKAFVGVHVLGSDFKKMAPGTKRAAGDSIMARRRGGGRQHSDWNPIARQAFWLLGEQFNRRPESVWGRRLREYKVKFREKYPEPVKDASGKVRFTNGHIHRRAVWRTVTKFAEHLYGAWRRIEREEESEAQEPLRRSA